MAAQASAENSSRLQDWLPLDLQGKPLYHGIDEHARLDAVRPSITTVRQAWNDVDKCKELQKVILETVKAESLSRDLQGHLEAALQTIRFWADQPRSLERSNRGSSESKVGYEALELYTSNAGYKKVFGYINQIFRKQDIDTRLKEGAVALVELLTIDLYNLRLDNIGSSQFYNFQGVVHRGMTVTEDVMGAFYLLMAKPLKERNFSVPLTFVSTSANQRNIQEFLNTTEEGKQRLHWKIHIREIDPRLRASYRQQYPASVVSTICAIPISQISEYPNEQEVLLRGPLLQLLRIYEEVGISPCCLILWVCYLRGLKLHVNDQDNSGNNADGSQTISPIPFHLDKYDNTDTNLTTDSR